MSSERLGKREKHAFDSFFVPNSKILIVGSFPISKFTNPEAQNEIKDHEIRFFYGGEKNLLWKTLAQVFGVNLTSREEITEFLKSKGISIADIVNSCERKLTSTGHPKSTDQDLKNVDWNTNLKAQIQEHQIEILLFTSEWVKDNFLKHIDPTFPAEKMITLLSPSASGARAIGKDPQYKAWKQSKPELATFEFRLEQYTKVFQSIQNRIKVDISKVA